MDAVHFACLLISLATGEILGYEIQPVDAVLLVDGAPTYMRLTNSTSLEDVYACVLGNSKNVDSVIMATQMRGLIFDVGQVEENVNESIRRLSGRTVQSLWESEEELKMLKAQLARFLTADYRDRRLDPEVYPNGKLQSSTDWWHGGGQPGTYTGKRESSSAMPDLTNESVHPPAGRNPFLTTAKTNQKSLHVWTPTDRTSTKTYSIITEHYPSPGTAAADQNIPARSSASARHQPSPKPFLSGEDVKTEIAEARDGWDVTSDLSGKPQNASRNLDNSLEDRRGSRGRDVLAAGHAPPPEFIPDQVQHASSTHVLRLKTVAFPSRPSPTSSVGGGERTMMASPEGGGGAKKRDLQVRSAGGKKRRGLVTDDNDQNVQID